MSKNFITQDFFIKTILPYILIMWFSFNMYHLDKIWEYTNHILFWLLFIVLKDIFIHFYKSKDINITSLDTKKMNQDNVSWIIRVLIFNRRYIFPFVLISYILVLLINQTKVFWLELNINENILLVVVIVSWILTIFKDEVEKKYEIQTLSSLYTSTLIILTFVLSILWTYIILDQTSKLWNLSYIISFVSGVLIFLVWIMVLEDDDEEDNKRELIENTNLQKNT